MTMNAPLDLEATISLYNDTVCRDTGQYFCNQRPFSTPRTGNKATILSCGKAVMKNIYEALNQAESFIWIADWQMGFDIELVRRGYKSEHSGQLHKVIEKIISTKPVHVRILLFRSVKDTVPGTFDGLVAKRLNSLNNPKYPGSVVVALQEPTSAQKDSFDYSHHQKFVVVDGRIGFLGGIDLSYGRWETPEFDVVVDPDKFISNEVYSPCSIKLRPLSETERKVINKFDFANPYSDKLIDEGCQPRMPWQDVHVQFEGPSVVDMHRNFVRRWNGHLNSSSSDSPLVRRITRSWLEKIGGWERLRTSQSVTSGGAQMQIVRSVSNAHLKAEGDMPDDLQLFGAQRERDTWRACLKSWSGSHQDNILNAMANCIRSADNYVYIETQFFISNFGTWSSKKTNGSGQGTTKPEVDSTKIGNEDDGIKNIIVDALVDRILAHIKAKTPFHVYLVVPTHPEGPLSDGSVQKQHRLALLTIKHGSDSLINRIKRGLTAQKRNPEEWIQFLTVLNMRNYGATVQYARDPVTFNEDFEREIGRFVVTEQIYIHSKLMIVDDAVAIIGSANTNDRSLTGNGDTEIAAVIVDTEGVELRDLGSPTRQVQTRKFARELRQQLWKKHFGFMVDSVSEEDTKYFRSTERASRKSNSIPARIEHPPRFKSSEKKIKSLSGGGVWDDMLNRPCDPEVVRAIQKLALKNAETYEAVFLHTPRNATKEFSSNETLFHLPYPLAYDASGTIMKKSYLNCPVPLHLNQREKEEYLRQQEQNYERLVVAAGRDERYRGVIPPSLSRLFMTTTLLPHQRRALADPQFGRSQLLYSQRRVHDVDSAIQFLRENVGGFFLAAPLDWGMETKIDGNITKHSTVDIAQLDVLDDKKTRV
jgi:phospholipase D1/2